MSTSNQWKCSRRAEVKWFAAFLFFHLTQVQAQNRGEQGQEGASGSILPLPSELPAWWELEVSGAAIFALEMQGICPRGLECIFHNGFGLGATVLRREPQGLAWNLGYTAWVADGGAIYEAVGLHAFRAGLRQLLEMGFRIQPWIGAELAVLVLGDPLRPLTGGAGVTMLGGVHGELSAAFNLLFGGEVSLWSTLPFQSADGARRAEMPSFNLLSSLTVGVMVRLDSLKRS
ncbi:MAG: hypothetical protein NZM37_02550 [Sandaracinaceae bacterium]|nr:hypothetical protein [Sandaracinaceae bacterium]MDW8245076.1 hypothetical protein [Sandaracinaceae bacterium]